MKDFKDGVSYYTKSTVDIFFPEDDVCCHWCPMLGIESKSDRAYCRRTGEYLTAPKFGIGLRCPLKFKENDDE